MLGRLFTFTPPLPYGEYSSLSIVDDRSFSQHYFMSGQNSYWAQAHDGLAGAYLYSLHQGDYAFVSFSDGTQKMYVVHEVYRYVSDSNAEAAHGDPQMRLNGEGKEVRYQEALRAMSDGENILLATCLSGYYLPLSSKNYSLHVIGRLIVNLVKIN